MTGCQHTHRSVSDWIRLFEYVDDEGTVLATCPRAREAWSQGLGLWLEHVMGCATCREVARAQDAFSDDHLDCPECRGNLEVLYQLLGETEHYEPVTLWELERAELLLEELAPLSLEQQMKRVLTEPFYQQWGFVQRLLFDARAHWHRDPHHALERALLAVVAAEELDPDSYGAEWIADLEAKAHAYAANAHRIVGCFGAAEAEFERAEACLDRGVGSGQAAARVFSLKASLLKDAQRHREALALLGDLERFYEDVDERHQIGRLALKRAEILDAQGQPALAAEECARASAHLDPGRDPHLVLIARTSAVEALLTAGDTARARSLFDQLPPMPEPLAELQRHWVEGNLLRAEERHGEARAVYEEVRRGFADAGLHYRSALATLDLALTAHLEGGRLHEVRLMAEEATVQLTLAGAKPQAFAAQRLLLQAAQEGAVTLAVLEQVRRRLATLQPS